MPTAHLPRVEQSLHDAHSSSIESRLNPEFSSDQYRVTSWRVTSLASLTYTALFLTTALIGIWAAYDRVSASTRFLLFFAGFLLMIGIVHVGRKYETKRIVGILGLICAFTTLCLSLLFLLVHDWQSVTQNDFTVAPMIGELIQRYRPALDLRWDLHSNLMAGALVILLPFGWAGTQWAKEQQRSLRIIFGTICLIIATLTLILTASRGAIFALIIGTIVAAYGRWYFERAHSRSIAIASNSFLVLLFGVALFGYITLLLPRVDETSIIPWIGGTANSRIHLWRNMLPLVQDYLFTGSGLGSTAMVYSSYALMLHVPYFYHAHNIYLQIAIEQGIPGMLFFLGMVGSTLWAVFSVWKTGSPRFRGFYAATIASLIALLVHGFFDAELYAKSLVPILFVPFGFAIALRQAQTRRRLSEHHAYRPRAIHGFNAQHILLLTPLVVIIGLGLWPGAVANYHANLGAVAQTRAELSVYRWPEWGIQDQLRRSDNVDLSLAIAEYETALQFDAHNNSANRRLGQIELSHGDYAVAEEHLATAYWQQPETRATRQLLGEIYAVKGETQNAADLWQTIDDSAGQLQIRQWWYNSLGAEIESKQLSSVLNTLHQQ